MTHPTKGHITAALVLVAVLVPSAPAAASAGPPAGRVFAHVQPSYEASRPVQATSASNGFDWGDAGIGAAAMLGLIGAVGAAATATRDRAARQQLSARRT